MTVGLLGNKIGMTQIFDESGNIIPVTILKVGPCVVTQVKTVLKDGYNSIQIGYGNVSSKSLTQPELGHLQKSNLQPLKYLKSNCYPAFAEPLTGQPKTGKPLRSSR